MYGSRAVTLLVLISDDVINRILKLNIQTNILVYVTRCCTDLASKVLKERTFGQSSALLISLALKLSDVVFILFINVKMPTTVGILTIYEQNKLNAQLSWAWKKITTSEPDLICLVYKCSAEELLNLKFSRKPRKIYHRIYRLLQSWLTSENVVCPSRLLKKFGNIID